MKCPCAKDCPMRTADCHTKCLPFIQYRDIKLREYIEREKEREVDNFHIKGVLRSLKLRNVHNYK